MKTRKSIIFLANWILAVCLTLAGAAAVRAEGNLPLAADNTSRIYLQKLTGLIAAGTGFERIFQDADDVLTVEKYNENYELQGKLTLPTELSYYGGAFSGANANFLVFGQNNKEEDNATEVVRVVKYSKDWQRLGAASLRGDSQFAHEIRYPFDVGNNNMAEYGGRLYLVTGHEGYVDPQYNQGHQGFLMFEIDEASMTGRIADADLWHSFSQHIAIRDAGHIYVLEESEGSQYAKLTWYAGQTDYYGNLSGTSIPVLKYGGERTSAWAVPTYATTDGIALSSNNVITVGTSIDQSRYNDDTYTKAYNIYITVTPMDNFSEGATSFRWLTSDDVRGGYKGVYLTKISDDRFMVSWESGKDDSMAGAGEYDSLSSHVLHYVFLNGNGETISRVFTRPAAISCCVPVVKNGKVVFYASDAGTVAFYTIDASTGDFAKKVYRLAGKNAVWDFADGVLTVSGSGALYENLASSALQAIDDKVTKVVVKAGITQVSERTFAYLDNLEEAVLERGVATLKDRAFYGNDKLRRVAVPATLTSFGESVFDTGWTWIGSGLPVIYANIHCETGSAARTYAEANKIRYTLAAVTMEDVSLTYSGAAGQVPEAKAAATTGKLGPVQFYTDEACSKLTSSENGAAAAGGVPVNAGVYYMKADAAADEVFGAVTGTPAKYEIRPLSLSGAAVTVPEQEYTGKALKPVPAVVLKGKTLQKDIDYTVKEYRNNTNAGTAGVTVEGKGNYTGTQDGSFTIRKKSSAADPAPAQPGSADPTSAQPQPGDPAPAQPGSTDPTSAQPQPGTEEPAPGQPSTQQPGTAETKAAARPAGDNTPENPGKLTEVNDRIAAVKDDTKDVKGATFSLLQAKGVAKSSTSVKVSWKKVKGAKKYIIYGNACGKGKKYKKLTSVGKSKTSWTQKKLTKGKYYKYLVVAVNGSKVLASSKTIHVATSGGKVGNATSISLNKKTLTLKKGKSATVKATVKTGKLKVKKHRATAWESSDISVATVSKGKIKAVGTGTCTIYAYAQNGICAKVKVTVE